MEVSDEIAVKGPDSPLFEENLQLRLGSGNLNRVNRIQSRAESPVSARDLTEIENVGRSDAVAHVGQELPDFLEGLHVLWDALGVLRDRRDDNVSLVFATQGRDRTRLRSCGDFSGITAMGLSQRLLVDEQANALENVALQTVAASWTGTQ